MIIQYKGNYAFTFRSAILDFPSSIIGLTPAATEILLIRSLPKALRVFKFQMLTKYHHEKELSISQSGSLYDLRILLFILPEPG